MQRWGKYPITALTSPCEMRVTTGRINGYKKNTKQHGLTKEVIENSINEMKNRRIKDHTGSSGTDCQNKCYAFESTRGKILQAVPRVPRWALNINKLRNECAE